MINRERNLKMERYCVRIKGGMTFANSVGKAKKIIYKHINIIERNEIGKREGNEKDKITQRENEIKNGRKIEEKSTRKERKEKQSKEVK